MKPAFDIQKARARMTVLGLTYADIARFLGYERQAVGHWFRNRGAPSVQDLKKMASILQMDVAELISPDAVIANSEVEKETVQTMRELSSSDAEMVRMFARTLKAKKAAP
ncbi:MAG: helix-turn-helix transcriptional regulator [Rhodanobacteraceae bacterium]